MCTYKPLSTNEMKNVDNEMNDLDAKAMYLMLNE